MLTTNGFELDVPLPLPVPLLVAVAAAVGVFLGLVDIGFSRLIGVILGN